MAEAVSTFQKFFREQVLARPAVQTCSSNKLYNTFATGVEMPYAIFKVIPLKDGVGQARQSYQKNFLVDLKWVTGLPVPATIYEAKQAVEDYFRTSLSFVYEGFRISIRHDRPIEMPEFGASAAEQLLHIGDTYRVWVHNVE